MSIIYDTIKTLNIEQFKNSENFNKILLVAASVFDELNLVFSDIKNLLNIDVNSGKQLDLIGDIVVQSRNGLDDAEYREVLKLKIFKNTSSGFVEDVTYILRIITNATKVVYSDNPPASYTIYTNGTNLSNDIKKTLDNLSPAGVSLIVYASYGEVPFIATEINTVRDVLEDGYGGIITTYLGENIEVDYLSSTGVNTLQDIFGGTDFGVVKLEPLEIEQGGILEIEQGGILEVYPENHEIIGSGKANIVYQ